MRFSFTPTHAVLALLVGAAALLLVGVMLYTNAEQGRERTLEGAEVAAAASGLAAGLEPGSNEEAVLADVVRREHLVGALVLDPVGRVAAQSAGRRLDGIDWNAALAPVSADEAGDQLMRRSWQGEVFWMATSPTADGRRVVLLRTVTPDDTPVGWVLAVAALLWLLVAVVAFIVLRISRRPADLLVSLARDLVKSEDTTALELVQKKHDARSVLGERAKPLFQLASDLVAVRRRAKDSQTLANAFLQVGPHYVLLCTLGGRVLDANPAFYARTNMMPEWLRGQGIDVLEETLPMKPIMELAQRSKEENAAISGVPYALNVEGKRRAVDIALRTFPTGEGDTVLIILSDLTKERTLEHQIDQYTDALDLMVDQRVAELTAAHDAIEPLLDAAGLVVATFDRDGRVKRFNAGAERLTGRTAFSVPRFATFAQMLFADGTDREAFENWFSGARGHTLRLPVASPQGPRTLLWVRGEHRQAGEVVQRVIVGVEHTETVDTGPIVDSFVNSPPFPPNVDASEPGGDGYAFRPEKHL